MLRRFSGIMKKSTPLLCKSLLYILAALLCAGSLISCENNDGTDSETIVPIIAETESGDFADGSDDSEAVIATIAPLRDPSETETASEASIEEPSETVESETAERSTESETAAPLPPETESEAPTDAYIKEPDGTVDPDADSVIGIAISSARELMLIGRDEEYPMDADYVLVADIDLSDLADFKPIGDAKADAVFTGTFDGRGHSIVGMNITASDDTPLYLGLFSSVGSKNKSDPAIIKNLIIKNVSISWKTDGTGACGILCGRASGNVHVENISLVSGLINVTNEGTRMIGVGSLIGECRSNASENISNDMIHISDIFTNINVTVKSDISRGTSGIIGRIYARDIGTLKNIVQLGTIIHDNGMGNAICDSDYGADLTKNIYFLEGCGSDSDNIASAMSYESLTRGIIKLDETLWYIEEGKLPILKDAYESPIFSALDFVLLKLSNGETEENVQSDFTLDSTVFGEEIKWTSSDSAIIRINGNTAKVTKPTLGYADITLTASSGGLIKHYTVRVYSDAIVSVTRSGNELVAVNYPDGVTFNWTSYNVLTEKVIRTESGKNGSFALHDSDKNTLIKLTVDEFPDVIYYYSDLPTVYIDSEVGYYELDKSDRAAYMSVSTTPEYADTVYSNDILIRIRGNSTSRQSKRPFRIKLEEKTDMFGMGKSKHWCLIANWFDRSNLRNKLSYDLGSSLGLAGCESMFVTLFYNGEYCGIYQFCETVRIDDGRVEIFDWEEEAENVADAIAKADGLSEKERDALEDRLQRDMSWITSGKFGNYTISDYVDTSDYDITGGYLVENDDYYDEVTKFTTNKGVRLQLKNPEYLLTNDDMLDYLHGYIQDMENAIYASGRVNSDGLHYSDYMDVDSFIDFWMVNTVFKNVELLYKSCYFYKDTDGGKIIWGPIWDMDWSSGNPSIEMMKGETERYDSWNNDENRGEREFWYRALYNDPWFVLRLYERWWEIGDKLDAMMDELDEWSAKLALESEINISRWRHSMKYDDEIATLREWLTNRRAWLDEQMQTPTALMESLGFYMESEKLIITEVTENRLGYELTVTVNGDKIKSVDLLINGTVVRTIEGIKTGDKITVPYSELADGKYNSVEIIAKRESGKYIVLRSRRGVNGSSALEADYVYLQGK